jgi:hypothetical protein
LPNQCTIATGFISSKPGKLFFLPIAIIITLSLCKACVNNSRMHAATVSLATVLGQRPGWIETGLGLGHRPNQPNFLRLNVCLTPL